MAKDDWRYKRVEEVLPQWLPPLSRKEADRAARRIFRRFGGTQHGSVLLKGIPAMHRKATFENTWLRGRVRRCWISLKPTTGHFKGWGRLIHDVSHVIHQKRSPLLKQHSGGHAYLEYEIAQFVVAQGWVSTVKTCPTGNEPTASM